MADEQQRQNSDSSNNDDGNKPKSGKRRYFRRRRNKTNKKPDQRSGPQTSSENAGANKSGQRKSTSQQDRQASGNSGNNSGKKKRRSRRRRSSRRATQQQPEMKQAVQEAETLYEEPLSVYVYTHIVRADYRDSMSDYRPETSYLAGESRKESSVPAVTLTRDILDQLDHFFTVQEQGGEPPRRIEYDEADWADDDDWDGTEDDPENQI
ncbi:MAG: hypothetical protein R2873_20995 [Caldilineaceae bacterium]|nr:hypothetical protein [Caldilineaceae bacterium]